MLTFSQLLHLIYPVSQVNVVGITWGSWEPQLLKLAKQDLIISSDCFYDPGLTITNYHINNLKNNFFNFFFSCLWANSCNCFLFAWKESISFIYLLLQRAQFRLVTRTIFIQMEVIVSNNWTLQYLFQFCRGCCRVNPG